MARRREAPGRDLPDREEDPRSQLIRLKPTDLERTEFLWHPYLVADEFCTLAGPRGVGKTWMVMDMAARVAMGQTFPGNEIPRKPARVIYGTREGKLTGKMILGRFLNLGVNLRRVGFLDREWDLSDLAALEAKILRERAALVILDPLQSFFPGSSAYSAAAARRLCEQLSDLANQTQACILGILHLTKDNKHPRGSGEIENVARVTLQVGRSGLDGRSLFVQTKNNAARVGASWHYAIREDETGVGWQGEAPGEGLDELLQRPRKREGPRALATLFLRVLLREGPVRTGEIEAQAADQGLYMKTVRRAGAGLGVSLAEGTIYQVGREWWWKLPGAASEAECGQVSKCPSETLTARIEPGAEPKTPPMERSWPGRTELVASLEASPEQEDEDQREDSLSDDDCVFVLKAGRAKKEDT